MTEILLTGTLSRNPINQKLRGNLWTRCTHLKHLGTTIKTTATGSDIKHNIKLVFHLRGAHCKTSIDFTQNLVATGLCVTFKCHVLFYL